MLNINKIEIVSYTLGSLHRDCDRTTHRKSLPMLSVVQSTAGSYDIALDNGRQYHTRPMGAFIAPAGVLQTITHHNDPATGNMQAQWVFMDVLVNSAYRLDALFSFPVLLPPQYNKRLYEIFDSIRCNGGLCNTMAELYRLLEILLAVGTPRAAANMERERICEYIHAHCSGKISAEELAALLHISVPGVYRFFRKSFGKSPAAYINDTRMDHACLLLLDKRLQIKEIAADVGIHDVPYFSKLFKQKYGVSPSAFRRLNADKNEPFQ